MVEWLIKQIKQQLWDFLFGFYELNILGHPKKSFQRRGFLPTGPMASTRVD
jgi:hypothetical protein